VSINTLGFSNVRYNLRIIDRVIFLTKSKNEHTYYEMGFELIIITVYRIDCK
jgi:hypothetical protein